MLRSPLTLLTVVAAAPTPVWVDTDAGVDDVFQLVYACALHVQGTLEIIGVSTIQGNVNSTMAYRNAEAILKGLGCEVPVHPDLHSGRLPDDYNFYFGKDGLYGFTTNNTRWPTGRVPQFLKNFIDHPKKNATSAVEAIRNAFTEHQNLTVLCTAPTTNFKLVEKQHPGTLSRVKEFIIMGGGLSATSAPGKETYGGNAGPNGWAEYNVYLDPEALQAILATAKRVTFAPLDVTTDFRLDESANSTNIQSAFKHMPDGFGTFIAAIHEHYKQLAGSPSLPDMATLYTLLANSYSGGPFFNVTGVSVAVVPAEDLSHIKGLPKGTRPTDLGAISRAYYADKSDPSSAPRTFGPAQTVNCMDPRNDCTLLLPMPAMANMGWLRREGVSTVRTRILDTIAGVYKSTRKFGFMDARQ